MGFFIEIAIVFYMIGTLIMFGVLYKNQWVIGSARYKNKILSLIVLFSIFWLPIIIIAYIDDFIERRNSK